MSTEKEKREQLSKLLEMDFIEFQRDRGRRATVKDYADLFDVHPATMGQLMNGARLPDRKNIGKLGARLPRVYDILEMSMLVGNSLTAQAIVDSLPSLSENQLEEVLEVVRRFQK